jgi:hypothetical protein
MAQGPSQRRPLSFAAGALTLLLLLSSVLLATLSRRAAPPAPPAATALSVDVPGCDVTVVLYASALTGTVLGRDVGVALGGHLAALSRFGYSYRVVGAGEAATGGWRGREAWQGWRGRMRAYADAARDVAAARGGDALLVFVDAYDTLPLRGPDGLRAAFAAAARAGAAAHAHAPPGIVMGAESLCWSNCRPLPVTYWADRLRASCEELPKDRFVSGGTIMGHASELAALYSWILAAGFDDDQLGLSHWLGIYSSAGAIDSGHAIFGSVELGHYSLPSADALAGRGHFFEHFPWMSGPHEGAAAYAAVAAITTRQQRTGPNEATFLADAIATESARLARERLSHLTQARLQQFGGGLAALLAVCALARLIHINSGVICATLSTAARQRPQGIRCANVAATGAALGLLSLLLWLFGAALRSAMFSLLHEAPAPAPSHPTVPFAAAFSSEYSSRVTPPVAALFFARTQPVATLAAIRSWRSIYPAAPLFIQGDATPLNFSGAAASFAPAAFAENSVMISAVSFASAVDAAGAKAWFAVMREALSMFDATGAPDYFVLLEPDVRLVRPITLPLPYSINGVNVDMRHREWVARFVHMRRGNSYFPPYFGGMGGAVFNSSFWRHVLAHTPRSAFEAQVDLLYAEAFVEETETRHKTYPAGVLGTDEVMTAIALAFGGSIGPFGGLCESWQEDAAERIAGRSGPPVEVLHKDKSLYGAALSARDVSDLHWDAFSLPPGERMEVAPWAGVQPGLVIVGAVLFVGGAGRLILLR